MTDITPQQQVEARLRELMTTSDLAQPDDVAHLSRTVIFLWYDRRTMVLVDLAEVPEDGDLRGCLDLRAIEADLRGAFGGEPLPVTEWLAAG